MSNQLIFILGALVITGLVLPILMSSLLRKPEQPAPAHTTANAEIYQQQLADLQLDHETGKLTAEGLAEAKDELTRRLLQDTETQTTTATAPTSRALITAMVLGILLPVGAVSTYLTLGSPTALDPQQAATGTNASPELQSMADGLARKLETEGGTVQRWVMLARTYRTLEQYEKALPAYTQAVSMGGDEDVQLERAEVLALLHGGDFQGEPLQVIERILRQNPNHYHALLLAGSAAYAGDRFQQALKYWQKAKVQLQAGDGDVEELNRAIAEAQDKLGQGKQLPQRSAVTSSAQMTVSGRLELGNLARAQVNATDTVFIYAVATQGPKAPVAIVRTTVAQLPMSFMLDDSTAMNPEHKLSGQEAVWVKARVSKSGEAMPKPGDWVGTLGPVTPGTANLRLLINEQLP